MPTHPYIDIHLQERISLSKYRYSSPNSGPLLTDFLLGMTANLAVKLYNPNNLLDRDTQGPEIAKKLSERCENQFTGEKTTIFKHMSYPVLTDFSMSPVGRRSYRGV